MGSHRSPTATCASVTLLSALVSALVSALAVAALAGCPTVDLGDTPEDIGLCNPAGGLDYFRDTIWPTFIRHDTPDACTRAGGCHNEAGGNALGFRTQPIDFPLNFRQAQVYLNCGTENMSELLTKPLGGINAHGGGDIFPSASDPAVAAFLAWF